MLGHARPVGLLWGAYQQASDPDVGRQLRPADRRDQPVGFHRRLGDPDRQRQQRIGLYGAVARRALYRRDDARRLVGALFCRSEEHTSELQSLMRISYAVFCLKKKKTIKTTT